MESNMGGSEGVKRRPNRGIKKSDSISKKGRMIAEGGQTKGLPFPLPFY